MLFNGSMIGRLGAVLIVLAKPATAQDGIPQAYGSNTYREPVPTYAELPPCVPPGTPLPPGQRSDVASVVRMVLDEAVSYLCNGTAWEPTFSRVFVDAADPPADDCDTLDERGRHRAADGANRRAFWCLEREAMPGNYRWHYAALLELVTGQDNYSTDYAATGYTQ